MTLLLPREAVPDLAPAAEGGRGRLAATPPGSGSEITHGGASSSPSEEDVRFGEEEKAGRCSWRRLVG